MVIFAPLVAAVPPPTTRIAVVLLGIIILAITLYVLYVPLLLLNRLLKRDEIDPTEAAKWRRRFVIGLGTGTFPAVAGWYAMSRHKSKKQTRAKNEDATA